MARSSRFSLPSKSTNYLPHSSFVSRSKTVQNITTQNQQNVCHLPPFTKFLDNYKNRNTDVFSFRMTYRYTRDATASLRVQHRICNMICISIINPENLSSGLRIREFTKFFLVRDFPFYLEEMSKTVYS